VNLAEKTLPICPVSVEPSRPSLTRQSRHALSLEAPHTNCPSLEKSTAMIDPTEPCSVAMAAPVRASHVFRVLSSEPVAMIEPVELYMTHCTSAECATIEYFGLVGGSTLKCSGVRPIAPSSVMPDSVVTSGPGSASASPCRAA
jgi:hypothetical protein